MKLRKTYEVKDEYLKEAKSYAYQSRKFTSNRHDFHEGGLSNKQKKMFEGKVGEKAFKILLDDNKVKYEEDDTPYWERDEYDFLLPGHGESFKVDVKTRTEDFHIRTLEMVEQAQTHPKDVYISARLFKKSNTVKMIGWFSKKDMLRKAKIENNGYLDNYVMYDKDLRPMEDLEKYLFERIA